MRRIYICGPMTGLPDNNRAAFYLAAGYLREHTEYFPVHTAWMESGFEHEDYMQMALLMLGLCDAVYLLPGWERSKGAKIEVKKAEQLGIRCYKQGDL